MLEFKDILGHEQIKEHFQNAAATGKVSHAYILSGEEGMGKKTLANAFAMTLLCEEGGREPCMQCHACKQVLSGNHPDLIYVTHEKPASMGVDDIREQINDTIMVRPYSSQYKIYIVDEAQKMTVQAQNALLKTIEEPPAYAVIMLFDYKPGCIFTDHSFTVCAAETETIKRLCCEDLSGRKASGKGHSGRNIQCICKRKSGQSNSSGPVRGL